MSSAWFPFFSFSLNVVVDGFCVVQSAGYAESGERTWDYRSGSVCFVSRSFKSSSPAIFRDFRSSLALILRHRMFYTDATGTEYMINLLDTPGHADFSSELLRSLLPSQGALLLVDAAQGIQAQTLSVLESARKRNLKVIGAINKWDLVSSDDRGPRAVTELADLLDCDPSEILKVSAKTGMGVKGVLEGVVRMIPPPHEVGLGEGVTLVGDGRGGTRERMRAIVFDSYYDSFRGVVSLIAVVEGELKRGIFYRFFLPVRC